MIRFAIVLLVFFELTIALAGPDRVGNGGDALLCGETAQFLDEYEALANEEVLDLGPDLIVDPFQKAEAVLHRLSAVMPLRSSRYLQWLHGFKDEARFRSGIQLTDVDDAGLIAIPVQCRISQAVIQVTGEDVDVLGYRYLISKDIWDLMTPNSQTMLLLHELIYREALSSEVPNSLKVRMLNRMLSAQTIGFKDLIHKQALFGGIFFEDGSLSVAFRENDARRRVEIKAIGQGVFEYDISQNYEEATQLFLKNPHCDSFVLKPMPEIREGRPPQYGGYLKIEVDVQAKSYRLERDLTMDFVLAQDAQCQGFQFSNWSIQGPIRFQQGSRSPNYPLQLERRQDSKIPFYRRAVKFEALGDSSLQADQVKIGSIAQFRIDFGAGSFVEINEPAIEDQFIEKTFVLKVENKNGSLKATADGVGWDKLLTFEIWENEGIRTR